METLMPKNPKDLNDDGIVSAAEEIKYQYGIRKPQVNMTVPEDYITAGQSGVGYEAGVRYPNMGVNSPTAPGNYLDQTGYDAGLSNRAGINTRGSATAAAIANAASLRGLIYQNGQLIINNAAGSPEPATYITFEPDTAPKAMAIGSAGIAVAQKYGYDKLQKLLVKLYPSLAAFPGGASTELMKAVETELNQYGGSNMIAVTKTADGDFTGTKTFIQWLKERANGLNADGDGSKPLVTVNYTGKKTAFDVFKNMTNQLLGMNPTKKDFEDYYNELHNKEGQYKDVTTSGGTFTRNVNEQFDIQDFTMRYIVKRLDYNKDLKGVAGQTQNLIGQLAKAYGLEGKITSDKQIKFIKGMLTGKMQQDDVADALRQQASIAYSAFAQDLKDNPQLTLADVMDQYMSVYANTFELGGNEIAISDVAKFATGPEGAKRTTWDFEKELRGDKRFSYTKRANEEAQNMAVSFAKSFGVEI
jgi:hypothetical protein